MLRGVFNIQQVSVNSGFGSIHSAILTLAAKCLSAGQGIYDVRPQTDAELLNASSVAPGKCADTTRPRTELIQIFRAWNGDQI